MATIETTFRRGMVLSMVQRSIFCRFTGDVLDVRTCAVLVDVDGDPESVMSPAAADMIESDPDTMATLASKGYEIRRNGRDAFRDA